MPVLRGSLCVVVLAASAGIAGAQTGTAAPKPRPAMRARLDAAAPLAAPYAVADRALRSGDFDDAARAYAAATLKSPDDPVLRVLAGVALTTVKRADLAVTQFRAACRLTGDDLMASLLLQGALAQTGQTGEAQSVYLDAVRRFPKPDGGLDSTASLVRLQAALKTAPGSPVLYLLIGDAYNIAENLPLADAAYQKAMRLAPSWTKPRVNLGLLRLAQNKPADAARLFESALDRDPENTELLFYRADAQRQSGNLDGAIATYRRIETRATNRKTPGVAAQALTGLGQAYAAGGRLNDAVVALSRARTIAPTDPAPPAALGEVQAKQQNFDAAAQNYTDALRLNKASGLFGTQAVLYQALAQTQVAAGNPNGALTTLSRALVDEPGGAGLWHRLRAEILLSTGNQSGAEEAFRASLDAQTDAGVFPQETLASIAAKQLLPTLTALYRADLGTGGAGFAGAAPVPGAGLVGRGADAPPTPERELRAFAALAAITQYGSDTAQEITLREAVCRRRGHGADYYALADALDTRARDAAKAKAAYRKALNAGGLTDAQSERARLRARQLAAPATAP